MDYCKAMSDEAYALQSLCRERFDLVITDYPIPMVDGHRGTAHVIHNGGESMLKKHKTAGRENDSINGHSLTDELVQRINRRAYELYEQRGSESGHDVEDWLEAERLVMEQETHRKKEE